jgi:hypothetical protein
VASLSGKTVIVLHPHWKTKVKVFIKIAEIEGMLNSVL